MTQPAPLPDNVDEIFLRSDSATGKATLLILGGVGLCVLAVFGFVVAVLGHVDQLRLHFMSTLPLLGGLGLLAAGWAIARAPLQVAVGPSGLVIEGRRGRQRHTWEQIGWAAVGTSAFGGKRMLTVYDTRGKAIAQISDAFDHFETLVQLVTAHVNRRTDDTASRIQSKKSRLNAWLALATGTGLLAAVIAVASMTWHEARANRLLAEQGVPGEGEIARRFLAPNGVTPRLEYRVRTPTGDAPTRNAEVTRDYWDHLIGATTVPIIHVPGEPALSRLAEGEVLDDDFFKTPAGGYGLAGMGALLSLFILGVGVMQFLGWDIDVDSKTGKFSIRRFGGG